MNLHMAQQAAQVKQCILKTLNAPVHFSTAVMEVYSREGAPGNISKISSQVFQPHSRCTLQHMDGGCEHGWKPLQTAGKLEFRCSFFTVDVLYIKAFQKGKFSF